MLDTMTMNNSATFSKKSCLKKGMPEPTSRRTVTFSNTDTIRPISTRSELSSEEIRELWFTEAEFKIIKLAVVQVLRKIVAGTYMHEMDSLESEARGLENKTPRGSNSRKKNRYASLYAVLHEQERQRLEHGRTVDSEFIAELSRQSTAQCQIKAVEMAAVDAKLALEEQTMFDLKTSKNVSPSLSSSPGTRRPSLVRKAISLSRRRLLMMS